MAEPTTRKSFFLPLAFNEARIHPPCRLWNS